MRKDMDWRRGNRLETLEATCVQRTSTAAIFALSDGERVLAPSDVAGELRVNERAALSIDHAAGGRVVHVARLLDGRPANKTQPVMEAK